ncbi:MAG: hypothetical protein ABI166_03370, partial [Mucilaginibacter sp.]
MYNQEEKDMNTQDKEFDDLFRSKLDNFEVEPAASIWPGIDAELGGKRKKGIFFMLSIAASVIILMIAGILFIPKKDAVDHTKPVKNNLAVNHTVVPDVKKDVKNVNPVNPPIKEGVQVAAVQVPVEHILRPHTVKNMVVPATNKGQEAAAVVKTEPVKIVPQQVLATLSEKPANVIEPTVPGIETPLMVATKEADTNKTAAITSTPALAATQIPAIKQVQPVVKKRGIHNMGDLVNLVLARVDKRKDKAIEFTDTDDDESVVTAINMGP